MAVNVRIDSECCKGCGLCVSVCTKHCITISEQSNSKGYFPAVVHDVGCTGCAMCALVCPDAGIEIHRDNGSPDQTPRQDQTHLIKGRS